MAIGIAGNSTYQSSSSASSYTLASYTPATGSDRILVVRIHGLRTNDAGAFTVDSVTFGGVGLTEAVSGKTTSSVRQYRTAIWYLINPSGSSGDIVVTFSQGASGCIISADTLTGALQLSPVGQTGSDSTSPTATIADTESTANAIGILAVTSHCGNDPVWTFSDSGGVASYTEQYDIRTFSTNNAKPSGAGASVLNPTAVTNHRIAQSQSSPQVAVLAVFKPAASETITATAGDGLGVSESATPRRVLRVSAADVTGMATSTGRRANIIANSMDLIALLEVATRARHSSHATTDAAVGIDALSMTWPLLVGDSAGLSEALAMAAQLSASDAAGVATAVMLARLLSISDTAAVDEAATARASLIAAASDALGYVTNVQTTISTSAGDALALTTALAARRALVAAAIDPLKLTEILSGDMGEVLEAVASDAAGLVALALGGWTGQATGADAAELTDTAARAMHFTQNVVSAGGLSVMAAVVKQARVTGVDAAGLAEQLRNDWGLSVDDTAGISATTQLVAFLYALAADVAAVSEGTSTRWHVEARDTAEFVASVAGAMHWVMAVQDTLGVGDLSMFVNPAGVVVIEMTINPVTARLHLKPVTIGFEIAMPHVDLRLSS